MTRWKKSGCCSFFPIFSERLKRTSSNTTKKNLSLNCFRVTRHSGQRYPTKNLTNRKAKLITSKKMLISVISILFGFHLLFQSCSDTYITYLGILKALSIDTILNVVFTRRWSFHKDRWQITLALYCWSNAPTTLLVAMMFGDNVMEATEEGVLLTFPQSDPIRH